MESSVKGGSQEIIPGYFQKSSGLKYDNGYYLKVGASYCYYIVFYDSWGDLAGYSIYLQE